VGGQEKDESQGGKEKEERLAPDPGLPRHAPTFLDRLFDPRRLAPKKERKGERKKEKHAAIAELFRVKEEHRKKKKRRKGGKKRTPLLRIYAECLSTRCARPSPDSGEHSEGQNRRERKKANFWSTTALDCLPRHRRGGEPLREKRKRGEVLATAVSPPARALCPPGRAHRPEKRGKK